MTKFSLKIILFLFMSLKIGFAQNRPEQLFKEMLSDSAFENVDYAFFLANSLIDSFPESEYVLSAKSIKLQHYEDLKDTAEILRINHEFLNYGRLNEEKELPRKWRRRFSWKLHLHEAAKDLFTIHKAQNHVDSAYHYLKMSIEKSPRVRGCGQYMEENALEEYNGYLDYYFDKKDTLKAVQTFINHVFNKAFAYQYSTDRIKHAIKAYYGLDAFKKEWQNVTYYSKVSSKGWFRKKYTYFVKMFGVEYPINYYSFSNEGISPSIFREQLESKRYYKDIQSWE